MLNHGQNDIILSEISQPQKDSIAQAGLKLTR